MKLTSESKFFVGIIAVTLAIIGIAVILLSRPAKPIDKTVLITPTTYTTGNINAPLWLVEFSDFECPACKVFFPTVETLISNNKETLLFAHRHFPLSQHQYALKTAIAAEAAGRQGKFWEMWKKLYEADVLSDEAIKKAATSLALDEGKFASDSADASLTTSIEKDVTLGESLGVTATPTFYLNGVKLTVRTPEELKTKVEEALKK